MKIEKMKRINLMLDQATLAATDTLIAEIQRKGGKALSRSEVVRAVCRAVEESLRRLDMGLPVLESGDELRETLVDWIIEAEQASQKLALIHTSTPAGRKP
jgi:GTP1/Obg family GTP-binding protein